MLLLAGCLACETDSFLRDPQTLIFHTQNFLLSSTHRKLYRFHLFQNSLLKAMFMVVDIRSFQGRFRCRVATILSNDCSNVTYKNPYVPCDSFRIEISVIFLLIRIFFLFLYDKKITGFFHGLQFIAIVCLAQRHCWNERCETTFLCFEKIGNFDMVNIFRLFSLLSIFFVLSLFIW